MPNALGSQSLPAKQLISALFKIQNALIIAKF